MRIAKYPIENLILNRWSSRAMSGEPIKQEEFLCLIEAARWAPSSYNGQPWRFIYAHRDTSTWNKLFDLLIPINQSWVIRSAVLIVVISKKTFEYNGQPSRTNLSDTGSAWQNFALQGSAMGLIIHGLEGFDYDKARKDLNIPDDYNVVMMVAVGKPGRKEDLPKELQARENPSDRKPIDELIFEGEWKSK